ncbi:hypothetical protein, partial [Salmonella sp. SAL4433]|uniref:hypothetical protein n=1 Tax=Salmonella sp. SAL4433 TaxID=3159888 RepID=UPI00397B3E9A
MAALDSRLRKGLEVGGLSMLLETRAGVASYPAHAQTGKELLRGADIALHRAKDSGATVCVFEQGDGAE